MFLRMCYAKRNFYSSTLVSFCEDATQRVCRCVNTTTVSGAAY